MNRDEVERLIERLCDEYLRELIAEDRRERRRPVLDVEDTLDGLHDVMSEEAEALSLGRVDQLRADGLALLVRTGKDLTGSDLDALLYELARTRLVALKKIADERQNDLHGIPRELPVAAASPSTATPMPSLALSEIIRRYIEDHEGKTWAPRTGPMIKSALAEMLEIVADRPVREVSKQDVRRYRLALDKLPAHAGIRYAGRRINEVLAEK